jgi:hypothetical protein
VLRGRMMLLLVPFIAGTAVTGCGSSLRPGSTVAPRSSAAQPVQRFLQGLDEVDASWRTASQLHPLPAAFGACVSSSAAKRNECIARLARRTPAVGKPPRGSAEVCDALSPAAQRQVIGLLHRVGIPALGSPVAELAAGAGYPPSCTDALRVFLTVGPAFEVAGGVMDRRLALGQKRYSRPVQVVGVNGDTAVVRVAGSSKTVPVEDLGGSWRIASLNFTGLPGP